MAKVFISYKRLDESFVRKLDRGLRDRGHDTWVDLDDIPPTAVFLERIQIGIETADAFIAVLTPESAASEVCGQEVKYASSLNKRLIPIVRREVDRHALPAALRERNWIFFRESDDYDAALSTLLDAIVTDLAWVETHTRLTVRATEWDRRSRNKSLLLHGRDLVETEALIRDVEGKSPPIAPIQQEYLEASRAASLVHPTRGGSAFGAVAVATLVLMTLFQAWMFRPVILIVTALLGTLPFRLPWACMLVFALSRVAWYEGLVGSSRWFLGDFAVIEWSLTNLSIHPGRFEIILHGGFCFLSSTLIAIWAASMSPLFAWRSVGLAWLAAAVLAISCIGIMQGAASSHTTDSCKMYFVLSDALGWAALGALLGILPLKPPFGDRRPLIVIMRENLSALRFRGS